MAWENLGLEILQEFSSHAPLARSEWLDDVERGCRIIVRAGALVPAVRRCVCGKDISAKRPEARYCSPRCQDRSRWEPADKAMVCPVCEIQFRRTNNRQRCCSPKCRKKHRDMAKCVAR